MWHAEPCLEYWASQPFFWVRPPSKLVSFLYPPHPTCWFPGLILWYHPPTLFMCFFTWDSLEYPGVPQVSRGSQWRNTTLAYFLVHWFLYKVLMYGIESWQMQSYITIAAIKVYVSFSPHCPTKIPCHPFVVNPASFSAPGKHWSVSSFYNVLLF